MTSSAAPANRAGISQEGSMPLGPRISRMSSSGAGADAGAESDADPGLEPDREPDREPDPDPDRESDPGADSDGGSEAGAEERFGGVKNSGVAGARVTGAEGEADWEAGAGRGRGAGSTGPACGRTAFALAEFALAAV